MTINETQKLSRLARYSQEEFLSEGSLLNQTRLNRFILIAVLLHASVIILQSLIVENSKDSLTPPPIKIKYVDIQKPQPLEREEALMKVPKTKNAKKQKTKPSKLFASADGRAHTNKKPTKQKKYRQTKTATPQTLRKPNSTQRTRTQMRFKKAPTQSKHRTTDKNPSPTPSDKATVIPEAAQKNVPSVPSERLSSRGVLSMLNGFDLGKYAMQDTRPRVEESSDEDESISLNTTETKYVSYFNRIKHQIQLVWRYPTQAAQRRVSGQLTLKFQISRNGNLLGVRLIDNSGFEILDTAALKAVKEAAPYYPFPVTIPKKKLSILATFVYSPNLNQLNAQQ